ncbi:MAG: hypothetical protein AAGK98_07355 [Pseudomonadota bacterium]
MTPETAARFFTRSDGSYVFARWGRPVAPVVFGMEPPSIAVFKGAVEALCHVTGHSMAETDPELGSNLMIFALRDWQELVETPNLDRLIPDLAELVQRLEAAEANQYRIFRFDPEGGIRAAFVFLRFDAHLAEVPAEALALGQIAQTMVLWSDEAFLGTTPIELVDGRAMLRREVTALLKAAYDPVLPTATREATHAHRLAARVGVFE